MVANAKKRTGQIVVKHDGTVLSSGISTVNFTGDIEAELSMSNPGQVDVYVVGTTSSGSVQDYTANCPSSVEVDDFVYVTGPAISGVLQVNTVDITNIETMPAFGIVVDKITPILCTVRVSGEVASGSALTPGKRYFIDSSGKPSDTMPDPDPGGKAAVQAAAYALDTNRLILTLNSVTIVRVG